MFKSTFTLAILLSAITFTAQSQTPIKFGKIEMADLEMNTYEKDTSANAVVLADYGDTYFQYNEMQGHFQAIFDRHIRIKVLNKNGYDWADGAIPFYETNGAKESVSSLKGFTHNLEDGKLVKYKLEKSATFEEKVNDNWNQLKFTMPNVQEGSVVEYSYKITSDFIFQLRSWDFQKSIPVIWSEYKVAIPEYYDYKQLYQGYVPFTVNEQGKKGDYFTYTSKDRTEGRGTNFSNEKVEYITQTYRWACQDVPAFKKEKHMTTMEDYITRIELELASRKLPNSPREPIMDNWETMNKKLLESESFGKQLNRRGFFKDKLASLTSGLSTSEEKMAAIFSFVQGHMEWNNSSRRYSDGIKKAFDAKKGSSADINLLLTAMLQEAGLAANPIILSTRDHGKVNTIYPILSKFNYVVCLVEIGEKSYLLDATEKFLSLDDLPFRCMNGQGRVVSDTPKWVNLLGAGSLTQITSAKLVLSDDGILSGTIEVSDNGYNAASFRSMISSSGEDKFVQEIAAKRSNWTIGSHSFENVSDPSKSLKSAYQVSLEDMAQVAGNLIYLNPMLTEGEEDSPFKLEQREYPVDRGCPTKEMFMMELTLPEGYQVEELPEKKILALPDDGGSFRYSVSQVGQKVQVISSISFKKHFFAPQEYVVLKELYAQIVSKHAEQIVLKKI